ncbi:MAG: YafY family transcriptional regulator [Chitinophagales bacterium]|nr:YafY family transcriptional regulator [Chitinophagales bacterium]
MNRMDRLLGILTLLQSRKYVTAEKIAGKFSISIRTVYRDVKALGELGIPVSFEAPKGYFVVQGYFLPPVSFSTAEANALLLIEVLVNGFTDQSVRKQYASALDKIRAVLHGSQKEELERLNEKVRFQKPDCFNLNFEYLPTLQNAIAARTILEIEYINQKEENSKRKLEPIGLIFYAFNWHLIGWCYTRRDYRDFRVSRIKKLKDTGLPFKRKTHIELNEYMKQLPVNY